jgi:hypothetical protein
MIQFFNTIKTWFSHQDAKAAVQEITPVVSALIAVLHTLGLVGNHVATIVQDVVDVSNNASGSLSGTEKLSIVSANVAKLASDAGLEKVAAASTTVAQIGYQLAKEQGLFTK